MTKSKYRLLFDRQAGICAVCLQPLEGGEFGWTGFGVHHIKKKSQQGSDELTNLVLTHNFCNVRLEDKPNFARKIGLVKLKKDTVGDINQK